MKYEYLIKHGGANFDQIELNQLGEQGWELVEVCLFASSSSSGADKVFYFKRIKK